MKNSRKGIINEIERYAVKDGPGIRTVVFLKGCPLRCLWCSNPETQKASNQLMYWNNRCIGCRQCIQLCPSNALSWEPTGVTIHHSSCITCSACVNTCNSNALQMSGQTISVDEVVEIVMKDAPYYKHSCGGVTFSGGEPTSQPLFLYEAAAALKKKGITTCIETCGYSEWNNYQRILPYMDFFFFDLKIMDEREHIRLTGVSNNLILENYAKLVKAGCNITVRIPIIPSINDTDKNINDTIEFLRTTSPGCHVSLLPYHRLGVSKYNKLDMPYQLNDLLPPSDSKMQHVREQFEIQGFRVTIGE